MAHSQGQQSDICKQGTNTYNVELGGSVRFQGLEQIVKVLEGFLCKAQLHPEFFKIHQNERLINFRGGRGESPGSLLPQQSV